MDRISWRSELLALCLVVGAVLSVTPNDLGNLQETTADLLGIYRRTPPFQYQAVIDAGARVVNLVDLGTFFVLWVPPDYEAREAKRVMVVMHGSVGSAYAGIDKELDMAAKYGYALVAVQWWKGRPDQYYTPLEMYNLIALALRYMAETYDVGVHKAAYVGFSMGSARSYEITYWDRALGTHYFALTISHSGGIPVDNPMPFVTRLLNGEFGASPLAGTRFFMYCGMQDEEWGTAQCAKMHNAERIVTEYGAVVERFIEDPNGLHRGYRLNPEYHDAGVQTFIRLTSD